MSDPVPAIPAHDAIQTLYVEHHRWLLGFLRRRLGGSDHAADLAHDTFERIMGVDSQPILAQPRAYLTTVAKRLLFRHHRRGAIEAAYLDVLAARGEPCEPSVESRLIVVETLVELCRLVDGMDARTRGIFLLAQLEGLSYPDVAHRMGCSLDIVKKTMSKALQRCFSVMYA
ncbi:sigma-70 family RNA polymerase sigma factor [Achromobacter sp.]|uniref:sigma-70 family RNA polymerase sigma factor n=1 Tax=Achromobacter sp. TaxID=134375 RepID=UPI0028A6B3F8|nr:sigma-70 family RNA polymerase sigma factor [Achromobacter sp.]